MNVFNPSDVAQERCLSMLRGARGGLFVEPPIPTRAGTPGLAARPGVGPARRAGRVALRALADTFRDQIADAGWTRVASRRGVQRAIAPGV